jgi:hypothetical protein
VSLIGFAHPTRSRPAVRQADTGDGAALWRLHRRTIQRTACRPVLRRRAPAPRKRPSFPDAVGLAGAAWSGQGSSGTEEQQSRPALLLVVPSGREATRFRDARSSRKVPGATLPVPAHDTAADRRSCPSSSNKHGEGSGRRARVRRGSGPAAPRGTRRRALKTLLPLRSTAISFCPAAATGRSAVVHSSTTLEWWGGLSDACRSRVRRVARAGDQGGLAMRTKFRLMKLAMSASALMALAIDLGAARKFS